MNEMQPVYILQENTKRESGKNATHNNILAAREVANAISSTLGPVGRDKLLVDSLGNITVTNDGVTILREMNVDNPVAKMIVEIAKTQEEACGDGTTSCVILAGELLAKAEELLNKGIHPSILAKGYRMAEKKAQQILNEMAEDVEICAESNEIFLNICRTAMTGKGVESNKDELAAMVVCGALAVLNKNGQVSLQDIKVEELEGEPVSKSEIIYGVVLNKEKVHPQMPEEIESATIALLSGGMEVKKTEIEARLNITTPEQMESFIQKEEKNLQDMVLHLQNLGVNVVFCEQNIDDPFAHILSQKGICGVKRVKREDLKKLAKATGGDIVGNWKELNENNLGRAGRVVEKFISKEKYIFVEYCTNPKAVTLFIRGGTEHIASEGKRAVTDALGDLVSIINNKKAVGGAGSVEVRLSKALKQWATTVGGKEQLAVLAFAESIEVIPHTLANNSGLDAIDILTKLRACTEGWFGIDVFTGEVMDAWANGVIEPLQVKTQALSSATEVAEIILRVDDVIISQPKRQQMGDPHEQMQRM